MIRFLGFAAVAAVALVTSAHANDAGCVVTDPTGTPLNIRDAPNGHITGSIVNGVIVHTLITKIVTGKRWTKITPESSNNFDEGWVFSNYISCNNNVIAGVVISRGASKSFSNDSRGMWSKTVESILLARGFSPTNAFKYSTYYPERRSVILTNTEKIQTFSKNPAIFARQLPSCYAINESRDCKLIYSGWGDLYSGPSNVPPLRNADQCRMTEAQRTYCRRYEFTTEQINQGCGRDYGGAADLVVFDGPQDKSSTKMSFSAAQSHQDYLNIEKQNKTSGKISDGIPMCKGHPAG